MEEAASEIENLSGNGAVKITSVEVLSDSWYVLRKVDFEFRHRDGTVTHESREAYDRGNGATILLFDPDRRTVVLTRQFRLPAYVNGHPNGMLIEAPAGLLDEQEAEEAIRREVEEETGFRPQAIERLFEIYMSPGSVTERVTFFAAACARADQVADGGGVREDGEDIEVLELPLAKAMEMIDTGEIADGKTILLLLWASRQRWARGPA